MDRRKLETFFKLLFGKHTGYVCIAHHPPTGGMLENYFLYPDELARMIEHSEDFSLDNDVYFCPQLLGGRKRNKDNVQTCTNLWSDLDACPPEVLLVEPTVLVESSPKRYQGYWVLDKPVPGEQAEDLSRRIAYYHAEDGADKSGWDLSQLLRVPYTYNNKYEERALVHVLSANQKHYRPSDFDDYPQPEEFEYFEVPFPDDLPEVDAATLLQARKAEINPTVWTLFYETPTQDWSKALWQLELLLFESGYAREEVFLVCEAAACNKFRRDKKPREYLWKDVCKAEAKVKEKESQLYFQAGDIDPPVLLTDEERDHIEATPTIVEEYIEWAKTLGDAAWQYHEAGVFIILSSLLSSSIRLPTSYGIVTPNLWLLILADTTLTRKTTAMDIAMDMILDIDSDCVLATDGSIEGLLTSLSTRPSRASIFLRDEFSGLLEMMTRRDYYAGMAETLTKMYDGKFQKRVLRKEIIEIRDPILIVYAGGIRTRIYELMDYGYVTSGFIPRFIFISADSDITRLRPLGPPTERNVEERGALLAKLRGLYEHYTAEQVMHIGDKEVVVPKKWDAELTPEAWVRYNKFEADMLQTGLDSDRADLMTPTMDRLAKSGLKMAVLLSATRSKEGVLVTEEDIVRAFYYIERWSIFTLDLITNIGKTTSERLLERINKAIKAQPGITRSALMQNNHLNARDADLIFNTLEQRGQITKTKVGRGMRYEPAVR
jgi:hypothetical protein